MLKASVYWLGNRTYIKKNGGKLGGGGMFRII